MSNVHITSFQVHYTIPEGEMSEDIKLRIIKEVDRVFEDNESLGAAIWRNEKGSVVAVLTDEKYSFFFDGEEIGGEEYMEVDSILNKVKDIVPFRDYQITVWGITSLDEQRRHGREYMKIPREFDYLGDYQFAPTFRWENNGEPTVIGIFPDPDDIQKYSWTFSATHIIVGDDVPALSSVIPSWIGRAKENSLSLCQYLYR